MSNTLIEGIEYAKFAIKVLEQLHKQTEEGEATQSLSRKDNEVAMF